MIKIYAIISVVFLFSNTLFAQQYLRYKTLEKTSLESKHLGSTKHMTVTVPIEWQESTSNTFPLLILFDRQRQRDTDFILHSIDNLTNTDQMPSMVVISIESEPAKRTAETTYSTTHKDGLAEKNERFIFKEVIPWANKNYKANAYTLLIGHSRHGFFSTSLFQSKIHALNAVISFSPFLFENKVNLLDSLSKLSQMHFNETKYYRYVLGNDNTTAYYQLDSIFYNLTNIQINTNGVLYENANHYAIPTLGISQCLYEIFEYWAMENKKDIYNDDLITFNQNMKAHYGQVLNRSLFTLNENAWQNFETGNYKTSLSIWQTLIRLYPNFSEAYLSIIKVEKKLNLNSKSTVKAFKKSLEKSMLYSEFKKIELLDEL